MNEYIRDFQIEKIQTYIAEDVQVCNNILTDKETNSFLIFHMNIRGINKNLDELKVVLESIANRIDCMVLSETRIIHNLDIYNINGYDLIYNDSKINQNDGVVVYIRKSLTYKYEIVDINNIKAIQLNLKHNDKNIIITSLYRSPSTCPTEFNTGLHDYLENCKTVSDIHVIVGDVNIDILSDKDDAHQYLNIVKEYGFLSAINNYTRVDGNSKSCIDHLLIKSMSKQYKCIPVIFQTSITDHFSQISQIIFPEKQKNTVTNNIKTKTYLDKLNLFEKLNKENWGDVFGCSDIEAATDLFINKLKNYIEICTKTVKIKNSEKKRSNWITPGLIKSVNKKSILFKISKKQPNEFNKNNFKQYRNKLNELLKIAKRDYYQNLINKNMNNSKQLWRCVNELTSSGKKIGDDITTIRTNEGELIQDKLEISNIFVNHFTDIGKKLADKIDQTKKCNVVQNIRNSNNSIFLSNTSEKEVVETIYQLKSNKAPGIDNIKSEILKDIAPRISAPLTYIINKCFESGTCPSAFKIAVIKPLFKSGDAVDVINYRPISLISNIAKIFEKILKNRITSFLNKFNILSEKQFGFREQRSTQDAIAYLTTKIYKNINISKPTLCIFVDLAKAFDTVSHTQLLHTLESIGFRGTPYQLMLSYLTNREQCVNIGNIMSSRKIVEYGVPQGTVLGPILFNIYLNSLFDLHLRGDIISFADDTAILYTDENWSDLKEKAENDFKNIISFFNSKLLTINYTKTYYVPFTSYSTGLPDFDALNLKMGSMEINIQSKQNIKYLGIYIDSFLRWNVHTNYVTNKLRSLFHKFKYLSQILNIAQLRTLYFALVETHLTYGLIAWGGVVYSHLKQLEKTQKYILKIIYNKIYTYPSNELFIETRILDIRQLFCLAILIRQYKNKNELEEIQHSYQTRYKSNATRLPKVEKTVAQRCYSYLGPKIYNEVPPHLKKINSISLFKKKIKEWIQAKSRMDIHKLIDPQNMYP